MTSERFVNPPLKRHPTLRPLSREHYNGLMLARHLREAAAGDEPARHGTTGLLREAWGTELEAHFADEERIVGPLVGDGERARLIEEHRSLERRIRMAIETETAPSSEWLLETAEMLEHHIRWEERELFLAAECADGAALDGMADEAARIDRERPGSRRRQDRP